MEQFTKQNSSLCRNSNQQYCLYRKREQIIIFFSKKKPSVTKHSPPCNVYYFNAIFLIEYTYSLIGIVKSKSTRRTEI